MIKIIQLFILTQIRNKFSLMWGIIAPTVFFLTLSTTTTNTVSLLIGIISMAIVGTGMTTFSAIFLGLRDSHFLIMLRTSKRSVISFSFAILISLIIFMLIQMLFLTFINIIFFNVKIFISYDILFMGLLIFICTAICFFAVGFLFSSIIKRSQNAVNVISLLSFMLMFTGGSFSPVGSKSLLQYINYINPVHIFNSNIRLLFVNGAIDINYIIQSLISLLIISLICIAIGVKYFKYTGKE